MANVARAILILFVVIMISGCNKEDKARVKACVDVKDKFKQKGTPGLFLFVDATQSMTGFVDDHNSTYSKFIRNNLHTLADSNRPAKFFSFGDKIDNITDNNFIWVSINKEFYQQSNTLLSEPLKKVLDKSPSSFVIISDMVISTERGKRNAEIDMIGEQIMKLSQNGYSFTLIGIKSQFNGDAYSEILRSTIKQSNDENQLFEGARPFYLLVGYRKGSEPKNLPNPPEKIKFIDNAALPTFSTPPGFIDSGFNFLKECDKKANDSSAYVVSWKEDKTINKANFSLTIETIANETAIDNITIETAVLRTQTDEKIADIHVVMSKDDKKHKTKLEIEIPRKLLKTVTNNDNTSNCKTKDYSYYAIDLMMKNENIKIDKWVGEWSTQDDSNIASFTKTFGLEDIVSIISDGIVKPLRFYLIIENQQQ
ncbi:MAG: hypothetical protein HQK95_02310 [Nitrospirae bacterium]|nr:hypothetical protein [Nitrospirota bacterium]